MNEPFKNLKSRQKHGLIFFFNPNFKQISADEFIDCDEQ